MIILRLAAPNDGNGNPRRVFVAFDGSVVGAWDEGYLGSDAIPEALRGSYGGITIEVTPREYRRYLAFARAYTAIGETT